jgi:hypothetical protein
MYASISLSVYANDSLSVCASVCASVNVAYVPT